MLLRLIGMGPQKTLAVHINPHVVLGYANCSQTRAARDTELRLDGWYLRLRLPLWSK